MKDERDLEVVEKPKKSKGVIIGFIVLILIILGMAGYILVDKGIIKIDSKKTNSIEKEEVNKNTKTEELSIDDKLVIEQMNKAKSEFTFGSINYFENDSFYAKNLTNEQKFMLAFSQIENLPVGCKKGKNDCLEDKNGNTIYETKTVSKNEIDKIMRNLFGPKYSYNNDNIDDAASSIPTSVKYDKNKEEYVFTGIPFGYTAFEDVGRWHFKTYVEKASKTEKEIRINCKVWIQVLMMEESNDGSDDYIQYYNMYKANAVEENLDKYLIKKSETGEINVEEADTYQYTFKYDDENKNYYFYSVELVK